jgi:1-acyl-sn-glycerol-3-phosphate acyltransferase
VTVWHGEEMPRPAIGPGGWLRIVARGLILGLLVYLGLCLLLLIRLIERPLHGLNRPWTPQITRLVCRTAFPIMGIGYSITGQPMTHRGAIVANHASWLDIFALNAAQSLYFVAKSEVAGWAGIGWLAQATGTVFIARKGTEAKAQQALFEERLRAGHRLAFFPEGTSTDGRRVLPFKSTLFAAFYTHGLDHILQIQPATLVYHPPVGADPRFYGWWGDMDFAPHLLQVLAAPRQGRVEVVFHAPLSVDGFVDRKALAAECARLVRGAISPMAPIGT